MLDQFFSSLSFVDIFNFCVFLVFSVCYVYQIFYVFVTLTKKPPQLTAKKNHRYAVIVAARNENAVIGDLIHSIRVQNYPQELIDIFVVADNCTDNTAAVAQEAGAIVFPRFNKEHIGKGYALDYGFSFMREAKYLSQARLTLGTSCAVSGTGFFISAKIIDEMGGWKYHMLTEDIEFSTASIVRGRRISYTPTAMLYDEQPLTFRDSWNQRFRWAKGFYQVFFGYGGKLVKGIFTNPKGSRFACYDMLMTICPAMLLTIITIAFNAIIAVLGVTGVMSTGVMITSSLSSIFFCLFNFTLFMFMFGALTTFTEWDNIHAPARKKIFYMFTFPLFMITYIPIALVALVKKASWKPIQHSISVDVQEFAQANAKDADRI